jgi:hypothetical protein
MDDADRADSRIEDMIADGIARVKRREERQLPSIGVCHWCESPVTAGRDSARRNATMTTSTSASAARILDYEQSHRQAS